MARSKKVGKKKGVGKGSAPPPPMSLEPAVTPAAIEVAAVASAPRIVLGDVLDQTAAGPLRAELLSHRGVDAVIDAAAVRRIGGQCLQVLLSAAATWTRDGAALALVNSSQEFIAGVRLLGIDPGELDSRKPFAGAA
jgi:chemotaxis protein CheX